MVYSLEIPIARLLRKHDVLYFFINEVMMFLPPMGEASHFNTVSTLRLTTLAADKNSYNTENAVIARETILYNWLRDVDYWKIIEHYSVFGNIVKEDIRKHVKMMMRDMKSYICYRGLSAPLVRLPRKMNATRKRLYPWTPGQLVQDVVLPMNERYHNTELLRMFCQGPWPNNYVGFIREVVLDDIFSALRLCLERDGDFVSVLDVDHLYTAVARGLHWHGVVVVMFAGRRLINEIN